MFAAVNQEPVDEFDQFVNYELHKSRELYDPYRDHDWNENM